MTVASGFYGKNLVQFLDGTITASGMQSANTWCLLTTDLYTPDFDAHEFRTSVTNEIPNGNGYTTGGAQLSTFGTNTFTTPTTGLFNFDTGSPAWTTSTISNAESAVLYNSTGTAGTDELYLISDFGAPVSTANGTLTVTVDTNGWVRFDYNPN